MPTLEDTAVDFPVTTLNDLLEAEAKAGVTVGADEEKYRRWAFLSTGAAGLLAIILAVVLITGGDDGGGGSKSGAAVDAKAYPGMPRKVLTVVPVGSDIQLNTAVDISKAGTLVVSDAKVTKINQPKDAVSNATVEVALTPEQLSKVNEAFPKGTEKATITAHVAGTATSATTATTAPASSAPTPPDSTGTVDTSPVTTPPTSG